MRRECGLAPAGVHEVHAVAELVRDGHEVAQRVGVVQQDVGLGVLGHGGAERTAALAGPRLGVDAALVEERPRHAADLGREPTEGLVHHPARLLVRHGAAATQRRILVGQRQAIEPEQPGLVAEPLLGDAVAALDRRHHGLDRRGVEPVVQVPCGQRVGIATQAVEHEPVGDEAVVRVRQDRCPRLQGVVQRLQGAQPKLALRVVHVGQQLVDRVVALPAAVVERHAHVGDGLLEEVLPRRRGRRAALGQHALLGLRQPVRLVAAHGAQVVAIAGHLRRVGQALGHVVVERDPVQLEEAQRVGRAHHPLLDHRLEVAGLVVVHVDRAAQPWAQELNPAERVRDRRELLQGRGQLRPVEDANAAPVALRERVARFERLVQQRAGGVGVGDDARQVPAHALGPRAGGLQRAGPHWSGFPSSRCRSGACAGWAAARSCRPPGWAACPRRPAPSGGAAHGRLPPSACMASLGISISFVDWPSASSAGPRGTCTPAGPAGDRRVDRLEQLLDGLGLARARAG